MTTPEPYDPESVPVVPETWTPVVKARKTDANTRDRMCKHFGVRVRLDAPIDGSPVQLSQKCTTCVNFGDGDCVMTVRYGSTGVRAWTRTPPGNPVMATIGNKRKILQGNTNVPWGLVTATEVSAVQLPVPVYRMIEAGNPIGPVRKDNPYSPIPHILGLIDDGPMIEENDSKLAITFPLADWPNHFLLGVVAYDDHNTAYIRMGSKTFRSPYDILLLQNELPVTIAEYYDFRWTDVRGYGFCVTRNEVTPESWAKIQIRRTPIMTPPRSPEPIKGQATLTCLSKEVRPLYTPRTHTAIS